MNLRQRFFNALSRQQTIKFYDTEGIKEQRYTVFSVNDPYVNTEIGDIFMHWHEGRENLPNEWYKDVYESGVTTVVIPAMLIPEGLTDDQLDFIARDGAYSNDGRNVQVYARVF